jgi:hypothetical protein
MYTYMPVPPPVTRPTLPERSIVLEMLMMICFELSEVHQYIVQCLSFHELVRRRSTPKVCSYLPELSLLSNVVSLNLLPMTNCHYTVYPSFHDLVIHRC